MCLPDLIRDCLPSLLSAIVGGLISSIASYMVMKSTFRQQEVMEDNRRNQQDTRREADFRLDSLLRLQEAILASARLTTKCALQLVGQIESGAPFLSCEVNAADDEKLSYELRMVLLMSSRVKSASLSRACDGFRAACWDVLLPKESVTAGEDILSKLREMNEELTALLDAVKKSVDSLACGTGSGF